MLSPPTPHSYAGWTSRSLATAPQPPAPRESSRLRCSQPIRVPHARSGPCSSHTSRAPLPPAVSTGLWWTSPCPSPGAPDLSTTPFGAGAPACRRPGMSSACAAVIVRASRGVRRRAGLPPGAGCYLRRPVRTYGTPRVPTGDRGAYLRGRPAYLRETPRVPTGDDFRSKPFLHKHFGLRDCKADEQFLSSSVPHCVHK